MSQNSRVQKKLYVVIGSDGQSDDLLELIDDIVWGISEVGVVRDDLQSHSLHKRKYCKVWCLTLNELQFFETKNGDYTRGGIKPGIAHAIFSSEVKKCFTLF